VSDVGPHQSPIRIKAWEISYQEIFPPLADLLPQKTVGTTPCPRLIGFTDPLAHPCGRPTQCWLTAWAYHLIKSFPSCLYFRDGAAA